MIGSISSNMASSWANALFSKLDTNNQGYIQKSDLQSAFSQISGNSSSSSSNVDDVFQQLDGNNDGKVTKDEMTSALKNLFSQLDQQFNDMRMQGSGQGGIGGSNGMPPPPPPQDGQDAGFTKDQLSSQLQEIGSSDSKRSELINKIVNNFDKADTNGDGKVSFKEAMAYDQSTSGTVSSSSSTSSTSSTTATDSSGTTTSAGTQNNDLSVMLKIMQLMQAYQVFGQDSNQASASQSLSVSA